MSVYQGDEWVRGSATTSKRAARSMERIADGAMPHQKLP